MVHGDDFVSTGLDSSLKWFEQTLSKQLNIKTDVIGPEKDDVSFIHALKLLDD